MNTAPVGTNKVRVLVVDDSSFIRRAVIRMFEDHPLIAIVDLAADGQMAIDLIKKQRPDVVTLDVQMPVLDGIAALERIMKECPVPVVMLSSLTGKGGDQTLKALELGAVDFIDKSCAGGAMEFATLIDELAAKILVAARVDLSKLGNKEDGRLVPLGGMGKTVPSATEVVVVGISTGGPPALQTILPALPPSFPCPILIVQHMPVGFTASLAERLNRSSSIAVKEAEEGETPLPGTAYIAPGGRHMVVRRCSGVLRICLDCQPATTLHMPSVDVLLDSAAKVCGHRSLAFVLTGMGKDGAAGARAIKTAGGRVVVESAETAIVFGMPKAVMEATTVDGVVPLHQVAEQMIAMTAPRPAALS
jgi:two-component system chemotaxis response regulator CheB